MIINRCLAGANLAKDSSIIIYVMHARVKLGVVARATVVVATVAPNPHYIYNGTLTANMHGIDCHKQP